MIYDLVYGLLFAISGFVMPKTGKMAPCQRKTPEYPQA